MAAITLVLLVIGAFFTLGMFAVISLLRFMGNRSEEKEMDRRRKNGEASRP